MSVGLKVPPGPSWRVLQMCLAVRLEGLYRLRLAVQRQQVGLGWCVTRRRGKQRYGALVVAGCQKRVGAKPRSDKPLPLGVRGVPGFERRGGIGISETGLERGAGREAGAIRRLRPQVQRHRAGRKGAPECHHDAQCRAS